MSATWEPTTETPLIRTSVPRLHAITLAAAVATSPWSEDTRKSRDHLLLWPALTLLLAGAFISISGIGGVNVDVKKAGPVLSAAITLYWLLAYVMRAITDLQVHSFRGTRELEQWIRTQQAIEEKVADIEGRIWDISRRDAEQVVNSQISIEEASEFRTPAGIQLKNERDEITALMEDANRTIRRAGTATKIRNTVDLLLPSLIGIVAIGVALYRARYS